VSSASSNVNCSQGLPTKYWHVAKSRAAWTFVKLTVLASSRCMQRENGPRVGACDRWSTNSSSSEDRALRGGFWFNTEDDLRSSDLGLPDPAFESIGIGFRVASVPEPSTYALLFLAGGGGLLWQRRKASL